MRVLGNDAFLPYGSSVLEAARRIWRQLILVEDAMLVYRVVRSPERRVFYIDVGNVPPEDIPNYMEQVQTTLKKSQVVDKDTGRVDLRYNPLSVDEDYYLPVRGAETGTKIDTLAGGANATAIEDVEYIQKKLFAALKIPKAYLGYDEGLGAKATLSQEDIRFSRTIARIQRTVIAELNKMAIIHLFCNGFEGEDLLDFTLQLSNPSTIAQQQKLELFRSRFEIAQSAVGVEGLVSRDWIRKTLFTMTDNESEEIQQQRLEDKIQDLEIEAVKLPGGDEDDLSGGDTGADDLPPPEVSSDDRNTSGLPILSEEDFDISKMSINDDTSPIKVQNRVDMFASLIGEKKKNETQAQRDIANHKRRTNKHGMSNHSKMVSHDDDPADSLNNPDGMKLEKQKQNSEKKDPSGLKSDLRALNSLGRITEDEEFIGDFLNSKIEHQSRMTSNIKSTLKSLENSISNNKGKIILESEITQNGEA